MSIQLAAALLLLLTVSWVDGTTVTYSNVLPRHNVTGDIIDAHDGSYNQWSPGGPWYYYAMGYGDCKQGGDMCAGGCGYGYSWIGVWKSPDMSNGSWTLVREARDVRGAGGWPELIYFRVHVVFNRPNNQYVLWVNLNGGDSDYAVGFAASPEGPFKFSHVTNVSRPRGGDFDILVDDDDQAYIIYTSVTNNHTMQVEKLTPDYGHSMAVAGASGASNVSSGVFGSVFVEAPALFKRKGVYYALFDNCCCFCGGGSGVGVYTAASALGPWLYHENIGCGADSLNPGCGCGMNHAGCPAEYNTAVTKAQQNFVMRVGDSYIWTGDQWQSAADGVKAHDLQYWAVLSFQADQTGIEVPVRLQWQDQISFQV